MSVHTLDGTDALFEIRVVQLVDWVYLTVRPSGPVEGHVNRLKMVKRQMFGRANFDLLRQRVLQRI
jgi:hypothetical protein